MRSGSRPLALCKVIKLECHVLSQASSQQVVRIPLAAFSAYNMFPLLLRCTNQSLPVLQETELLWGFALSLLRGQEAAAELQSALSFPVLWSPELDFSSMLFSWDLVGRKLLLWGSVFCTQQFLSLLLSHKSGGKGWLCWLCLWLASLGSCTFCSGLRCLGLSSSEGSGIAQMSAQVQGVKLTQKDKKMFKACILTTSSNHSKVKNNT